jgi:hypothetical protein
VDAPIAARLVRAACHVAGVAGDIDETRRLAEEALRRWQELGDRGASAEALSDIGMTFQWPGISIAQLGSSNGAEKQRVTSAT